MHQNNLQGAQSITDRQIAEKVISSEIISGRVGELSSEAYNCGWKSEGDVRTTENTPRGPLPAQ